MFVRQYNHFGVVDLNIKWSWNYPIAQQNEYSLSIKSFLYNPVYVRAAR